MRIRLHLSNLCNFKCPNCHVFELGENNLPNTLMSKNVFHQTILKAIEYAKAKNEKNISFSIYGGEPLANFQLIKDELDFFNNKFEDINLSWAINTNGSLLTEQDIIDLKKYQIDWHISVDGSEEVHNISRPTKGNKPTFHLVKNTLGLLKKHQIDFQINSYMMPSNENDLESIVDIAQEYNCQRIYLDSFYDETYQIINDKLEKYFHAYLYALKQSINLSGPWARAFNSKMDYLSFDVNIHGSFYFSDFPQISSQSPFFEQSIHELNLLHANKSEALTKFIDTKCGSCSLKSSCQGQGYLLYDYHLKKSVSNSSCLFYLEFFKKLNKEIFILKEKQYTLFSTFKIENPEKAKENILFYIKKFKDISGLETQPIQFFIFDNFHEFNSAIPKVKIPNWVNIYTSDKDKILKIGEEFNSTLLHELFHIFVLQNNLNLPQWIIEGFAEHIRDNDININDVKNSLHEKRFFKECDINSQNPNYFIELSPNNPDKNFAYLQTKYLFQNLKNEFGPIKLKNFILTSNMDNYLESFYNIFDVSLTNYCSKIGL